MLGKMGYALLGLMPAVTLTLSVAAPAAADPATSVPPALWANATCLETLAPEYSPTMWSVTTGSKPVTDYAIANWGSNNYNPGAGGPGTSKNSSDATQITDAENAGATVLGYVATDDGAGTSQNGYSKADIEDQMSQWYDWYGVTNFFLDQAPTATTHESLYGDLLSYAQTDISSSATTWLNMGAYPASSSWMSEGTEIGDWENGSAPTTPPSWTIDFPPTQFFGVMNDTPDSSADISAAVHDLEGAHVGIGFVTSDDTYQTLTTSYWDTFTTDASTPSSGSGCEY
jgi:hypothetical protein